MHCADLYMEYMNRVVKMTIEGLGTNKTEKVIVTAGKSVGSFSVILVAFDDEVGEASISSKHIENSMLKHLQKKL